MGISVKRYPFTAKLVSATVGNGNLCDFFLGYRAYKLNGYKILFVYIGFIIKRGNVYNLDALVFKVISEEFEKCIFSAVCKAVKPSPEIFDHLCRECEIRPEESIFIDDSPKNIKGSEDFGIRGYIFDGDVEKLRNYLTGLLSSQ